MSQDPNFLPLDFSPEVAKEVRRLVEKGDLLGAQKLILAEIEKQQPKADE